jgi:hypothetical protein
MQIPNIFIYPADTVYSISYDAVSVPMNPLKGVVLIGFKNQKNIWSLEINHDEISPPVSTSLFYYDTLPKFSFANNYQIGYIITVQSDGLLVSNDFYWNRDGKNSLRMYYYPM